jgi:hypothetical protein
MPPIPIGDSIIFFSAACATAHCEIPCGIYDDEMRINQYSQIFVKRIS